MNALRLGIVADFREENWASMDLVAEMLEREVRSGRAGEVRGENVCPPFIKSVMRVPGLGRRGAAFNADRVLNRMSFYSRHLKRRRGEFDCFHVCDHAYANTVLALPAERTGVFCHDLDTFRCLFEPVLEPRPRWFKAMMRKVLKGLERAALIFHTTSEVRRQIVARGIADEARLVQAYYGVSEAFAPEENPARPEAEILRALNGRPYLLHVGSCIPRKRIDVLLDVFVGVRGKIKDLKLVQAGGEWTAAQREQIERLKIGGDALQIGRQNQQVIAGLCRQALAVLQPSDAEGFGLPVAEALACGSPVVASAIPTLMEAGGSAALYCPVGAVEEWVAAVARVASDKSFAPSMEARLAQAAKFSWSAHALTICDAYRALTA